MSNWNILKENTANKFSKYPFLCHCTILFKIKFQFWKWRNYSFFMKRSANVIENQAVSFEILEHVDIGIITSSVESGQARIWSHFWARFGLFFMIYILTSSLKPNCHYESLNIENQGICHTSGSYIIIVCYSNWQLSCQAILTELEKRHLLQ